MVKGGKKTLALSSRTWGEGEEEPLRWMLVIKSPST